MRPENCTCVYGAVDAESDGTPVRGCIDGDCRCWVHGHDEGEDEDARLRRLCVAPGVCTFTSVCPQCEEEQA